MNISVNDIVEINNEKYIVIDKINEGKDFCFVNKLDKDLEPSDDFKVIELEEGKCLIITDEETLGKVLPIFEVNIQKEIEKLEI